MTKTWRRRAVACLVVALGTAGGVCRAVTLENIDVVHLIDKSQSIVRARVGSVADGIDERGLPYTEVTLSLLETLKGNVVESYTFRQFGLSRPRPMGNGRVMMPAPGPFPRFAEGEEVLLFLHAPARSTGLQTTVALDAGKFTLGPGRAENGLANEGTFRGVGMADGLATDNDRRMLSTMRGPVSPETLVSFVRRAVQENWIGTGKLWAAGAEPPLRRRVTRSVDIQGSYVKGGPR